MPKKAAKGKKGGKKDAMSTDEADLYPFGVKVDDIIQAEDLKSAGRSRSSRPPAHAPHLVAPDTARASSNGGWSRKGDPLAAVAGERPGAAPLKGALAATTRARTSRKIRHLGGSRCGPDRFLPRVGQVS